ncbi:TniQ family protein [Roseobacter weihaiensis]|uniref:TniQ family protein n=1 Tax=Roseobacter weihaiensis TaxID=2763262 RepID=UPI001D0B1F63|nr:TniQ family protein [Roseobacter sp. H9]
MIEILPIRLTASAAEPGFSILARNTAANASRTIKEFCAATGLNKALICAGDPEQLFALAKLTGSDPAHLQHNSPQQLDRKTSVINGNKVLNRSLRKADLSICPQCWLEQRETRGSKSYHLALNSTWLPRSVRTCIRHDVWLIELPYKDYTSCYDHLLRCKLTYGWLGSLASMLKRQPSSNFERAVLGQILLNQRICPWLGQVQVDVFERWCLGLGLFLETGSGRLNDFDEHAQFQMIDAGYDVMKSGRNALHVSVDAALGKHGVRLGKTWLYNWAMPSHSPPERSVFRSQMKDMCDAQGDYCLYTVASAPPVSRTVDLQLRKLSRLTGRSVSWTRNVLMTDGYLPSSGIPAQRHVNSQFYFWRTHILRLHNSLKTKTAASRLGLGVKGFGSLVHDGILSPIKSQVCVKPRFDTADLDTLMARVQRHVHPNPACRFAEFASIPKACFEVSCATSTVINLLMDGHLKSAIWTELDKGFAGIVIDPVELKSKLASFSKTGLTIEDLRDRLGLQYTQAKKTDSARPLARICGPKEQ